MKKRVIAHIDMDAFFAAIEQRDNPNLKGKPVVIGADPKRGKGRGVVSTCSYEARQYGIHSAMPISQAYKRCPHAIYIRNNLHKYKEASKQMFKILYDFTPDIEPISIDEAFLHITGSFHLFKTPHKTCLMIKNRIKDELKLTCSIGIAPVKMVAKIASDTCKPDGLLEIKPAELLHFLWSLPVERIWGVGKQTKKGLNDLGIHTIEDLAKTPKIELYKRFGEHGSHLFDLANGRDERDVVVDDMIKSVSHEHTFDIDTSDLEEVYDILSFISEKVSRRLRRYSLKGKTLSLKIRLSGFKTFTRAHTFDTKTYFYDDIYKHSKLLFEDFYESNMKIRLIGVKMSHFEDLYVKESLFEDPSSIRAEKVHTAIDMIKDKFGEKAIRRGMHKIKRGEIMFDAEISRQLMIRIHNSVGTLAQATSAISSSGINLTAICAYSVDDMVAIMFVTEDNNAAKHLLEDKGFDVNEEEVIILSVENKPGALQVVTDKIAEAGIELSLIYGSVDKDAAVSRIVLISKDNMEAIAFIKTMIERG